MKKLIKTFSRKQKKEARTLLARKVIYESFMIQVRIDFCNEIHMRHYGKAYE